MKRIKHSKKTKKKISDSLMNHNVSIKTRKKMSIYRKKHPVKYWLDKHRDDKTKLKIGLGNKNKMVSQKTKDAISDSMKGKIMSEQHKEILRARMKINNPSFGGLSIEHKRKISKNHSKHMLGKHLSECTKKLISKNTIAAMKNPIVKLKVRKARAKQKFPFSNTSIEIKLQNALNKQKIIFQTQKYQLIGIPDIFIKPNICIFCDGDYWHNRPSAQERDSYVNQTLAAQGYEVLRFWEHEINDNIKKCVDLINNIMSRPLQI